MTSGSVAAMKSFISRKRWKYLVKSRAVVSSEISLYCIFLDSLHPSRFHPEIKQAIDMITSALKTKKMKGGHV